MIPLIHILWWIVQRKWIKLIKFWDAYKNEKSGFYFSYLKALNY